MLGPVPPSTTILSARPQGTVSVWRASAPYVGVKDAWTLGVLRRGRVRHWSAGRSRALTEGAVVFARPGDVQRLTPLGDGVEVEVLQLGEPGALASLPRRVPYLEAHQPEATPFRRPGSEPEDLVAAWAALPADAHPANEAVERARRLLFVSHAERLSLEAVARAVGCGKFELARAFRSHAGIAPHAYRTRLRVQRAKALLRRGTPAAETAQRVGFYDQSHLHRHFRRLVGLTPRAYARQFGDS